MTEQKKGSKIGRVFARLLRAVASTAASAAIAKWQSDPRYLWLVPLLQAGGKALRERWPEVGGVVPF